MALLQERQRQEAEARRLADEEQRQADERRLEEEDEAWRLQQQAEYARLQVSRQGWSRNHVDVKYRWGRIHVELK